MTYIVSYMAGRMAYFDTNIVSVERIKEYSEVPSEVGPCWRVHLLACLGGLLFWLFLPFVPNSIPKQCVCSDGSVSH